MSTNAKAPLALLGAAGSPYTRKMLALLRFRRIPHAIHWGSIFALCLAGLAIGRSLVPASPRGSPDVSAFRASLEEEDWLDKWMQDGLDLLNN